MHSFEEVKTILADTLSLGEGKQLLEAQTALLGNIPELDSLAVINLIAGIEDYFGIVLDDDELDSKIFETVGSLAAFVDSKLGR